MEVDADEEPTAAKEQRLLHQPVEGVTFDAQLRTKIAYNGERANGHGKKVDDEQCPSRESQLFGVADPVSEGSIASGEFQQMVAVRGCRFPGARDPRPRDQAGKQAPGLA